MKTTHLLTFVLLLASGLSAAALAADPAGATGGGAVSAGGGFALEGALIDFGLPDSAGAAQGGGFKMDCGPFAVRQTRALANAADPVWDLYGLLDNKPSLSNPSGTLLASLYPEDAICLP